MTMDDEALWEQGFQRLENYVDAGYVVAEESEYIEPGYSWSSPVVAIEEMHEPYSPSQIEVATAVPGPSGTVEPPDYDPGSSGWEVWHDVGEVVKGAAVTVYDTTVGDVAQTAHVVDEGALIVEEITGGIAGKVYEEIPGVGETPDEFLFILTSDPDKGVAADLGLDSEFFGLVKDMIPMMMMIGVMQMMKGR